jgi:hypothetical protein
MPEPATHIARTIDGRFRVHTYANQSAELCNANSRVLVERSPIHVVIDAIAERGVSGTRASRLLRLRSLLGRAL